MPHRCEQETSRNCHAFNWIMGPILSQHNYSNDAPTRGSGTLSRTSSLLGLQLIAIELVKELSNFCRLRQSERERGKWKTGNGKQAQPQDIARRPSLSAFVSVSVFVCFTISGWRQGGACARHLKVGVPDDLKGF